MGVKKNTPIPSLASATNPKADLPFFDGCSCIQICSMKRTLPPLILILIGILSGCGNSTQWLPSATKPNPQYIFLEGSPLLVLDPVSGKSLSWHFDERYPWVNASIVASPNIIVAHTANRVAYVSKEKGTNRYLITLTDGVTSNAIATLGQDVHTVDLIGWSPDDQEIALRTSNSFDLGEDELATLNVGTGELTYHFTPAKETVWRPQSRELIAYLGDYMGAGLYVVDAKRENFKRLEQRAANYYIAPSPDGTRVAYGISNGDKLVIRNLLDDTTDEIFIKARWNERAWSPTQDKLVVLSETNGTQAIGGFRRDIQVIDLKTKAVATIAKGAVSYPTWSPDGKFIIYVRPEENNSSSNADLVKVNIETKEETILIENVNSSSRILGWR